MSRRWSSRISDGNSSTTPLGATGTTAIVFRSVATATAAVVTQITVTKPAGTVQDDVMVAFIQHDEATAVITPPAGWTTVRQDTRDANGGGMPGDDVNITSWTLRAGAAEPANYTWTFNVSTAAGAIGLIATYDNVILTGNPVNAHNGATETPGLGDDTVTAPSVSGTTAGSMLVAFFVATDAQGSFTPPAGMSERADLQGVADTVSAADQVFGAGGETGSRTATFSSALARELFGAQMLALTPAAPGGGGKFFGVAEEVTDFSNIRILYETDQFPSANGLEPQFSTDGTNWITFEKFPKAGLITGLGQIARAEQVTVRGRFFRLNYENGSAAQTFFRLQTILVPEADQDPSRAPDAGRMYTGTGNIDPGAFAAHVGTTLSGRDHTAAVEILGYGATPLKSTDVGAAFDYVVRLVFGAQTVHQQIVRGDDKAFVPLRILVNPNNAPKVEILHNQVLAQNFLSFLQVREF